MGVNGAFTGIHFLFEVNPELVCRCVRWQLYAQYLLIRGGMARAKGPGERVSEEMSW